MRFKHSDGEPEFVQITGGSRTMRASPSQFPDLQALAAGLTSVFRAKGCPGGQITVLDRQPNVYSSTFPSEIVTCRFGEESELSILCKYEAGRSHQVYGHRGDLAYEAEVYRHVLQ